MIAFSADHHFWNYPQFAQEGPNGVNSRLAEQLAVEDFLHMVFLDHGVTTHIRLGDLFERRNQVDAVVYREVQKRIVRNTKHGIHEVILGGNHDLAANGRRWTIEALASTPGVQVVLECTIVDVDGFPIVLAPYHPENRWIPRQRLTDGPAVLGCHVDLLGAKTSTEYRLKGPLNYEELHPEWYGQVMMGHVHLPQEYENGRYIGSLTQRNFSDAGPQRRIVLFNLENGEWCNIQLPGVKFVTVHVADEGDVVHEAEGADPNAYYQVHATSPMAGTKTEIEACFAGKCLGVVASAPSATKPSRIPGEKLQTLTTKDVVTLWAETAPHLDQELLHQLGHQFLGGESLGE